MWQGLNVPPPTSYLFLRPTFNSLPVFGPTSHLTLSATQYQLMRYTGRTLKFCADQLSGVFQHLFQTSLDTASIPTVWKTSTVIPIPKTNNPKQLNDFRPVALTSLVMKTLEKLVKSLILLITESQLDPLQFAYRAGRGVEYAKLFILDKVYTHLEKPTAHAKILFADFTSAFNLMQPHSLAHKLISACNIGNQLVA